MKKLSVDVAIIGAGTAGLSARREALKHGAKSVVIIENGPYGTTCARVGCMPSKLLIHPANVVHEATSAVDAGVHATLEINDEELLERVRRERDRFVGFVVEGVEKIPDAQRLRGTARFIDDHTLDVDGTRVEFKTAVIATGSYNNIPGLFEQVQRDYPEYILTNESIFEIPRFPTSLAVFGLGVIGLELGQAFTRLGVPTQFFGRTQQFCGTTDPKVYDVIKGILREEIETDWDSSIESIVGTPDGVSFKWRSADGTPHERTFERVLVAAGRRPNVAGLDLHKTSLSLDESGLPTIDYESGQAGTSNIFFAGDVTGERPLLHEAADDGRQAGRNAALYPDVQRRTRRTLLAITFTDPNIAVVGSTHASLEPGSFAAGEVSYFDQGRARVMQQNRGILRIYACRKTRKLIGAEGIAPSLEHLAHTLAWAIQGGFTIDEALSMPFYHPVTEEGVRTALQDLARNLDHPAE